MLAGNEDNYKNLDEFEFRRPAPTLDCYHVVIFLLACYSIFFILVDNQKYIKAWISLNFGQNPPLTMEIACP